MGGAKQQYQEMLETMTDTSEELAKKTLELLERSLEIVELKGCIRALKKQLLDSCVRGVPLLAKPTEHGSEPIVERRMGRPAPNGSVPAAAPVCGA